MRPQLTTALRALMIAALLTTTACAGNDDGSSLHSTGAQNRSSGEQSNVNNVYYPGADTDGGFTSPPPADDYQLGETFEDVPENDFIDAQTENTSTFSIDVDNASYTITRRDLLNRRLPNEAGVRPEEFINYFDYDYLEPTDHPFSINLEAAPSKFGAGKQLLRIGIKGKDIAVADLKPTNLVFLIDVSGSMQSTQKLGLVKESLRALLENLRPTDTVGIVIYAGAQGIALEPTPVSQKSLILSKIDDLRSGGGTNAEAGIVAAYKMAEQAKIEGGNNRVIILTDGDFNVGRTGQGLIDLIAEYREKHISLTCMGYGLGNYNDYHMENLAKEGNGNYFYVDSLEEAERVFGDELPGTLEVIASDVKIQVEFDTAAVKSYRLVGYDNRVLNNEDFRDDTKDAGEIGPGHTVTAFYELELTDTAAPTDVLSEVRVRYKDQYGVASQEFTRFVKVANIKASFDEASRDFRWGAAVTEFAEILRHSKHVDTPDLQAVEDTARAARPEISAKADELLKLVGIAKELWGAK